MVDVNNFTRGTGQAASTGWGNIIKDRIPETAGRVGSAAGRVGGMIGSIAATGVAVGAGVAGAVNWTAKGVVKGGLKVVNGSARMVDNPVGAFLVTTAATVAAALGVRSWWKNRQARKAQEVLLNSDEGLSLQQQIADNKQRLAQVSAELGKNNNPSGHMAETVRSPAIGVRQA